MLFSGFGKPDSMTNRGVRQGVRNVERRAVQAVVFTQRARYTALRPTRHEPLRVTAAPQATNNYKQLF